MWHFDGFLSNGENSIATDIFSHARAPDPMSGNTVTARGTPDSDQHSPRGEKGPLHIQNKSMGSALLHPESREHGHDHERAYDHDHDHDHKHDQEQEQAAAERLATKVVELEEMQKVYDALAAGKQETSDAESSLSDLKRQVESLKKEYWASW